MCGRFARHSSVRDFVRLIPGLSGETPADLNPRYNITPSQALLLARNGDEGNREWGSLYWGLLPHWAKDPKLRKPINARAETVHEKAYFRAAFKQRRCLIAADGYYEWQKRPAGKQPYYITLKSGGPFAFAGIWDRCRLDGVDLPHVSCAILTTAANDLTRPIHERMPVIVRPGDYESWLDLEIRDREALDAILRPYPDRLMDAWPVSTYVNSPVNDSQRCIERLA